MPAAAPLVAAPSRTCADAKQNARQPRLIVRALGIDGSPRGGGHTRRVIDAVLAGLPSEATSEVIDLAAGIDRALEGAERADAFVIGSPMYRASYAAPLKMLLDRLPRAMWGETSAPITGRAACIVGTGATWHHFLGLDALRSVLAGFFAAHVIPPGLYVPAEGFDAQGELLEHYRGLASQQGAALAELDMALTPDGALRALRPQA